MQVGRSFRFEPEFAYLSVASQRAILVGVGLFATKDVAPQVRMYVGPRIEMLTGDADGGAIGLSLGGEWLPVPRVALGAEARTAKTFGDEPNSAATAGLFFVRVFLN